MFGVFVSERLVRSRHQLRGQCYIREIRNSHTEFLAPLILLDIDDLRVDLDQGDGILSRANIRLQRKFAVTFRYVTGDDCGSLLLLTKPFAGAENQFYFCAVTDSDEPLGKRRLCASSPRLYLDNL
ncbi:MAG: hypothetical protein ABIK83_15740 [Candidatus Zixiibacteriota bacterium]